MNLEPGWSLRLTASARRRLVRLPEAAAGAVLETLEAIENDPHRLGKPLRLELEGHRVARRGPYRVIYRIDASERTVDVVAIGHRSDVYRPR